MAPAPTTSTAPTTGPSPGPTSRASDASAGVYKRLVLKDNRIIGTVLYGETADGAWFNDLKKKQTDIADTRETLIFGQAYQGGSPLDPMAAVAALPERRSCAPGAQEETARPVAKPP